MPAIHYEAAGVSSKTSTRPPIRSAREATARARSNQSRFGTQSASMNASTGARVVTTPRLRVGPAPLFLLAQEPHCGKPVMQSVRGLRRIVVDNNNFSSGYVVLHQVFEASLQPHNIVVMRNDNGDVGCGLNSSCRIHAHMPRRYSGICSGRFP